MYSEGTNDLKATITKQDINFHDWKGILKDRYREFLFVTKIEPKSKDGVTQKPMLRDLFDVIFNVIVSIVTFLKDSFQVATNGPQKFVPALFLSVFSDKQIRKPLRTGNFDLSKDLPEAIANRVLLMIYSYLQSHKYMALEKTLSIGARIVLLDSEKLLKNFHRAKGLDSDDEYEDLSGKEALVKPPLGYIGNEEVESLLLSYA